LCVPTQVAAAALIRDGCGAFCCQTPRSTCSDHGLTVFVKPTPDCPVLQQELWVWAENVIEDESLHLVTGIALGSFETVMLPTKDVAEALPGLSRRRLRPPATP
jgi:hypothetical protein